MLLTKRFRRANDTDVADEYYRYLSKRLDDIRFSVAIQQIIETHRHWPRPVDVLRAAPPPDVVTEGRYGLVREDADDIKAPTWFVLNGDTPEGQDWIEFFKNGGKQYPDDDKIRFPYGTNRPPDYEFDSRGLPCYPRSIGFDGLGTPRTRVKVLDSGGREWT